MPPRIEGGAVGRARSRHKRSRVATTHPTEQGFQQDSRPCISPVTTVATTHPTEQGFQRPASAPPRPATPGTPSTSAGTRSRRPSDLHMQTARSTPRIAALRPRIGTGPGIFSSDPRSGRSPGRTPAGPRDLAATAPVRQLPRSFLPRFGPPGDPSIGILYPLSRVTHRHYAPESAVNAPDLHGNLPAYRQRGG